jgi:hypothetical protein
MKVKDEEQTEQPCETTTMSTRVTPEFAELVRVTAPTLGFRNTSNLIEAALRFYLSSHGLPIRFPPPKVG